MGDKGWEVEDKGWELEDRGWGLEDRGLLKDGIARMFGFWNFGSYRTWLQLMCCTSLVVHP